MDCTIERLAAAEEAQQMQMAEKAVDVSPASMKSVAGGIRIVAASGAGPALVVTA